MQGSIIRTNVIQFLHFFIISTTFRWFRLFLLQGSIILHFIQHYGTHHWKMATSFFHLLKQISKTFLQILWIRFNWPAQDMKNVALSFLLLEIFNWSHDFDPFGPNNFIQIGNQTLQNNYISLKTNAVAECFIK